MIKIISSKRRHLVILDIAGPVCKEDVAAARDKISSSLSSMKNGYTLIEIYRHTPSLGDNSGLTIGDLMSMFYAAGRIWRVVKVSHNGATDPGLVILHRTRWKRHVFEVDAGDIRQALEMAAEELCENADWSGRQEQEELEFPAAST